MKLAPTQLKDQTTDSRESESQEKEGGTFLSPPAFSLTAGASSPVQAKLNGSQPAQLKEGDLTHTGKVGSGTVNARENDYDPSDKTNNNYSLSYEGADADDAHWLQFINLCMVATLPDGSLVYATGSVNATGGKMTYSNDKNTYWFVDSASNSDPYYEAGGSNQRDPKKSTKIFDIPGGPSIEGVAEDFVATKAPKATSVKFIMSFDTYLVQKNVSTYHVTWKATTPYDPAKKKSSAIDYDTTGGGTVKALPKELKDALDKRYTGNKIS